MKVTKDTYTIMAKAIAAYMPAGATERQRWDAMWRAVDGGWLDYRTMAGYQDTHIDTALRRISKDYGTLPALPDYNPRTRGNA